MNRPQVPHAPLRRRLLLLGLSAYLTQGLAMTPVLLKEPKTVYPDNPAMLALAQLVMRDDAKTLAQALQTNPDAVHNMGNHGVGLLMLAVANARPACVRLLMRAGANPHQPHTAISGIARPALYAMAIFPSPDIFTLMLEDGLDVNGGLEGHGVTLLKAAVSEPDDRRLRQLIATKKVDLNLADRVNNTPFTHAIDGILYDRALLLLDAGADPRVGRWNMLEDLIQRHDKWSPGTTNDRLRQELIRRLKALGMTEDTPMKVPTQRPRGERPKP